MKATSRDRRSSFDTRTLHFAFLAAASAAASLGSPIERVGALARFYVHILSHDLHALLSKCCCIATFLNLGCFGYISFASAHCLLQCTIEITSDGHALRKHNLETDSDDV
jgi:hypothetical protein